MKFDNYKKALANFIFPWTCKICGRSDNVDQGICSDCLSILPWCQRSCYQCGLPVHTSGTDHLICGQCLQKPPNFDHLHAALWYQPPISQLIAGFKYHQCWENVRCLINLFAMTDPLVPPKSRVIPIPSHPARIRERGFNVVYECMRFLKKQLPIKCDPSLLKRISYTETQTGKTRLQRRLNVKNSFAVSRPIQKENIILFDEVVTTGATVNEASRQLKRAGARHVIVWCIARTVR